MPDSVWQIVDVYKRQKQYRLEDQLLKYFPQEIETNKGYIQGFEADLETLAAHPHPADGFEMCIRDRYNTTYLPAI